MENKDYNATNGDYTSPEQENFGNPYGNTQYYNAQYNNAQYANLGGTPVDAAGNPLKSHFALQLVFAIIEIVCCCFSPIAMILGIIALVFAVQANSAYNRGMGEEFKTKSKTSNILLIVGGVFVAISIILNVVVFAFMPQILETSYSYIEEYEDELYGNGFYNDEDAEVFEEYVGTNEAPLVEGFESFTLNGVTYQIPMTYDEFLQMGYEIEDLDKNAVFEAQTFEYYDIYDANDYWVGAIRISNDMQEDMTVQECVIDYIQFYNDAAYDSSIETIDLTFGNGLNMNSTYEELKAWLGEPYYIYEEVVDDSSYTNYMWEYNGDDQYQCIDIYYLDGEISEVVIEQFEWVY